MLYDRARFEPLIEEPWNPERVPDAIGAIVADVDAAFAPDSFWPAFPWDSDDGEAQGSPPRGRLRSAAQP